jgi:hypothetical protein
MAEERPGSEGEEPLAAERARLREAARLLEAERERLRAEVGGRGSRREGRERAEDDERAERGERRRRRGGSLWASLLGIDPELSELWRMNRPGRVLCSFLQDPPDEFIDHLRAARREYLLAARSFVDFALEYNERRPNRPPRRGAVPIEGA